MHILKNFAGMLPQRVVVIGGGTGIYPVLRGFRDLRIYTTAVCTAFDSGGSTGALKRSYKGAALFQGDLRNAFAALSKLPEDHTRRAFLDVRIEGGSLDGHTLGNLMLLGLNQRWNVEETLERLRVEFELNGKALPVSLERAHLVARLSDGKVVHGESKIDTRKGDATLKKVWLQPRAAIYKPAADAIIEADLIVIGPGDLYTSLVPNLLVQGLEDAMNNTKAKIIVPVPLMTKHAETRHYKASDFIRELCRYGLGARVDSTIVVSTKRKNGESHRFVDAVIWNSRVAPTSLLEHYLEKEMSQPVAIDRDRAQHFHGAVLKECDLLSEGALESGLIRHDPHKTVRAILDAYTFLEGGRK